MGNLAPDVDETVLAREFGRFGPIASLKILWPRTDEERARGRNSGFIAFMARRDAEVRKRCPQAMRVLRWARRAQASASAALALQDALREMDGAILHDSEIRCGWSKPVRLPTVPLYVAGQALPQRYSSDTRRGMRDRDGPPRDFRGREWRDDRGGRSPPRGPHGDRDDGPRYPADDYPGRERWPEPRAEPRPEAEYLREIVVPADGKLRCVRRGLRECVGAEGACGSGFTPRPLPCRRYVIDTLAEMVVQDGWELEFLLMEQEKENPEYGWLTDTDSTAHAYYRWRLYSLAAGDNLRMWKIDEYVPFEVREGMWCALLDSPASCVDLRKGLAGNDPVRHA